MICSILIAALIIVFTLCYLFYRKSQISAKSQSMLPELQSKVIDEKEGIRTGNYGEISKHYLPKDIQTLHDAFMRGYKLTGDGPCLGRRTPNGPYTWLSYKEVYKQIQQLGSAFIHIGNLKSDSTACIGIFASNRIEWSICERACSMFSLIQCPLYETLGIEAIEHMIKQTESALVAVDNTARIEQLLSLKPHLPLLRFLIVFDQFDENIAKKAEDLGVKLYSFSECLKIGQKNLKEAILPKSEDIALLCYTSGSTGVPKGCMLTHKNIISMLDSCFVVAFDVGKLPVHELQLSHLSYLPMAHMFEKLAQMMMFLFGGKVGFYQGDIKLLMSDLQELKPTLFPTVPRLLNRLHDQVTLALNKAPLWKRMVFKLALHFKTQELKKGIRRNNSIWDYLVFKKISNGLGGNVKMLVTGSAPISQEVMTFVRCAVGCLVMEGYGQTETAGAATMTMPDEFIAGHVGPPLVNILVKLADVPDMNLKASEGVGEVCVKGPNVFIGYYKDPEATKKAFDSDGWLHTGDVGTWNKNGTLKVIDRCKYIFKLSQGEYIAPEKIESVYMESSFIEQIYIEGSSFESFLIAIIVPECRLIVNHLKTLNSFTISDIPDSKLEKSKSISSNPSTLNNDFVDLKLYSDESIKEIANLDPDCDKDRKKICENPLIKKMIQAKLNGLAKARGLKGFEQVRNIYLESTPFSVDNSLLTPTFKNRRHLLRQHYTDVIKKLYDDNRLANGGA